MGHAGTEWNDETMKAAASLWKEGRSAAQIAKVIGRSRSAVLGQAHRNPDIFKPRGKGRPSQEARRVVEKLRGPSARPASAKVERLPRAPRQPKPQPVKLPDDWADRVLIRLDLTRYKRDGFEPVAFVDLARTQCHFPLQSIEVKAGPDMPCCGAPVGERGEGLPDSYCPMHRELMTGRLA